MVEYIQAHAWMTAWEEQMAERGFPRARLDVAPTIDAEGSLGRSYSWTPDVDLLAYDADDDEMAAWLEMAGAVAHQTFLSVDSLRPSIVAPSPLLQQLLAERN